jgi:hypothetical protein
MSRRSFSLTPVVAAVLLVVVLSPIRAAGQARTTQATSTLPRTGDGQPDLQGVWNFGTLTPIERPADLAGRTHLTGEEVAAIEKKAELDSQKRTVDTMDHAKYAFDKRTSLIVDPPDGRMPPLTPNGQQRSRAHIRGLVRAPAGPEDRSLWDRCILGWNSGPPMIPAVPVGYNQNVQIIQTRDYVVIFNEQIHNARIVPLDGRPHGTIRQWVGDSRGRWEGHTLVVETTNFTPFGTGTITLKNSLRVVFDENLRLVERFTRVNADTLLYEFTIDDPTIWTRPWTVGVPMTKTQDKIFEYACHEANYAMKNMLSGARAVEASGGNQAEHCYSFDFDCEDAKMFEEDAKKVK